MQGIHLRKYGVEAKIPFVLYEVDGVDLRVDAADGGTDCALTKDEGAETTCANDFVDEGSGYSITLTATEMQAARITIYVIDSATKVWLDDAILIETYGHASAQHAMDFDDAVRGGLTALPNANADAGGGLPISDAGGLNLDTKLANTNEVTAARMAALTDWINGGRLDLLLDAIKVVTDNQADAATTLISGTVSYDNTSATTTIFYSDDITEVTADHYKGRIIIFTSGVMLGQASDITAYALDTGEGKFTVTQLTEAPPDNTTFVIV